MLPNNRQSEGRIVLAPMEGVLDYHVRQILTEINLFDYCVTEFVRVTHHLLTNRTFYRLCPELYHHGTTLTGTPVRVQLLGQDPILMAENGQKAIELGSYGIDVNCGCPAKTVVGSQGGAYLLNSPELIYQIVTKMRQAIHQATPLSVKIRLGFDDKSRCMEIAQAVEQGGASEIVIHGRTKADGYRADKIDWPTIGQLKASLTIPVIANGEIFSPQDAKNCRMQSCTPDIMLGRGILTLPNLANMIRFNQPAMSWQQVIQILHRYAITQIDEAKPFYHSARIKQWLSYLKQHYPQANDLLQGIRTLKEQQAMIDHLTCALDQR
ncbi:tRNA dihydrouridine(16) synthase DusC [Orbaceae bacterium ESL0727]|nr:tRNA dihydrouridine(16) synthase DusC [Orbaceae bacterium ESL0727]